MLRQLLLTLAITATAVQGTNRLGLPSWNEILTFLMQEGTYQETPETGVCGDLCYLRTKKVNLTLKQNESYTDPDDPCTKYICKPSGVFSEIINCTTIEDCENGPPVIFPGKCCEQCVPQFGEPCGFTEWGDYTRCSRTCDRGRQARERTCCNEEEEDALECTGILREWRDCQTQKCPINCEWEWTDFTECSVTCGGGKRTRYPNITQKPDFFGKPCPPNVTNNISESIDCNEDPCPPDKVDCEWEWSGYTECTVTCGGGKRTRYPIITQEPKYGGEQCPSDVEKNISQSIGCNEDPCPPVDCVWEWSDFTECTVTCDGGKRTRYPIITQEPKNDGEPCPSDVEKNISQSIDCNEDPCPVECKPGESYCDGKCIPDQDGDCISDGKDNCISKKNPDQEDQDGDGVGDVCDNCINAENPDQKNTDGDESGDLCDPDIDDDQFLNQQDKCPLVWDPEQIDTDGDGAGDACDNCKDVSNNNGAAKQKDSDGDGIGDACEESGQVYIKNDEDGDDIWDGFDNCRNVPNPLQEDSDHDLAGDACDNCPGLQRFSQRDLDGDGVGDPCDNCIFHVNKPGSDGKQADKDNDCIGDVCDNDGFADSDGDGVADKCDNCKDKKNPNQIDSDGDGVGDECDNCPNRFLPSNHCQGVENSLMMENMTEDEQKSLAVKIMERLLEMYFT